MNYAQPLSAAAQHYSGLLDDLMAEKLAEALRKTTAAQQAYNDALKYNLSDQEAKWFALCTEKIELGRVMDHFGIDRGLAREVLR